MEQGHERVLRGIKDSGSRTEFETGAVRDIQEGKGRCDLMPLDVMAILYARCGYQEEADVLNNIHLFQKTGHVGYLYDVLKRQTIFYSMSDMFLEVSVHMADGCAKYGERNWEKGIPTQRYVDSAVRHYLKCLRGDTDEPHNRAFCWNIMCAAWTCIHKPELNDYAEVSE